MSHISELELAVWDLTSLDAAMTLCGLERREQTTHKWYGVYLGDTPLPAGMTLDQLGKCNFAYGIPGNNKAYEIGVTQKPDGSYALFWDFWEGGFGLEEKIGENGCKLICEYEAQVYRKEMVNQGYEISEIVLADGTRELTAIRY